MNQRQRSGARTLILLAVAAAVAGSCANNAAKLTELQRVKSGTLDVVLLSPRDALRHGKDTFTIEFRSASGGNLVDVGTVRGSATMPMAGMPMMGSLDVQPTGVAGRYAAACELPMAGTWRMTVQWEGAGQGSVTFPGTVQ